MKSFDFFYDLASPYSFLAATQLAGIEQRTGAAVKLMPVTLGGIRKAVGTQMPPAQQIHYMAQDTARWAAKYKVKMQFPKVFPIANLKALRACVAAEAQGKSRRAMHALFDAYWAQGEDISDAKVIEAALAAAGLDGPGLVARIEDPEVKDQLRRYTELALARGVFGVPTFFVGERSFWGNDRVEFVERELSR